MFGTCPCDCCCGFIVAALDVAMREPERDAVREPMLRVAVAVCFPLRGVIVAAAAI